MSYKLHHRSTGRQLLEEQTLAEAGVEQGAELRLQPEIIAGATTAKDEHLAATYDSERFARFEKISWWSQERLSQARVVVVGAGALGNEVLKNLALLGVGHLLLLDLDRVEKSNLSRSVLFREFDQGKPKATVAEAALRGLAPTMKIASLIGPVQCTLGLGYIRWADVVVGAVDNREARVFLNSACAKVGRPWFDAGIEVLNGIVRGFQASTTACYECTMSRADWAELERRRSCALLARDAVEEGGVPTTPTTASILGGIQAQEVVKYLHQRESLLGKGFFFEGLNHTSYSINYTIRPDCPWHEEAPPVRVDPDVDRGTTLKSLLQRAEQELGAIDALELSREVVSHFECGECQRTSPVWRPLAGVTERDARCPQCQSSRTAHFLHTLGPDSTHLVRSPAELGLPSCDIVWARKGEEYLGFQIGHPEPLPQ